MGIVSRAPGAATASGLCGAASPRGMMRMGSVIAMILRHEPGSARARGSDSTTSGTAARNCAKPRGSRQPRPPRSGLVQPSIIETRAQQSSVRVLAVGARKARGGRGMRLEMAHNNFAFCQCAVEGSTDERGAWLGRRLPRVGHRAMVSGHRQVPLGYRRVRRWRGAAAFGGRRMSRAARQVEFLAREIQFLARGIQFPARGIQFRGRARARRAGGDSLICRARRDIIGEAPIRGYRTRTSDARGAGSGDGFFICACSAATFWRR